MDIKTLVIGMTVVLIALFIITDRYRKHEVEKMLAEGRYYELLKRLRDTPDDLNLKEEIYSHAKDYGQKTGMLESEIQKMVEKDMETFLKTRGVIN